METTTVKTLEQAVKEWQSGTLCALVEYRSSKAEPIQWRDKETHMVMRGVTLTHAVESDKGSMMVSERVPEDFNWKEYTSPFRKGQKVLCLFDSVGRTKGNTTLYGRLEAVSVDGNGTPATPTAQAKPTAETAKK